MDSMYGFQIKIAHLIGSLDIMTGNAGNRIALKNTKNKAKMHVTWVSRGVGKM